MKRISLSRQECLRLMDERGVLKHIVDHSLAVTRVALFLGEELNKKGQRLDLELLEAASLLHDLAKTECLKTRRDHALAGFQLLERMGYPRVGEVVAQHIQLWKESDPAWVTEEEVVNYADKRVRHDEIVSLRERFSDLKERYGGADLQAWAALERATFEIEEKIFSILGTTPEDLQFLFNPGGRRKNPHRKKRP